MTTEIRRARIAFAWVGVIVPSVILILTAVIVATWLPELPEPAATHWGTEGVNGYAPGWTYLVLPLAVGGGITALFALLGFFGHRMPQSSRVPSRAEGQQWSPTARFLGAVSLGMAAMMAVISLAGAGIQRGLADATDAPDILPWTLLGFVLLVGLSVLGWFLQPAAYGEADAGETARPLVLSGSERAVWMGTAVTARGGQIALGIAVLLVLATAVLLAVSGTLAWLIPAVVGVLLVVLAAVMLVFRVRVSDAGLQVRSAAGWPRVAIPADQVASARVVQVNPFAEFGGWGYRIGLDGRRGFVLRAGEALEVVQRNGAVFVVTVDDAATAAAVLAAAADAATTPGSTDEGASS